MSWMMWKIIVLRNDVTFEFYIRVHHSFDNMLERL